METEAEIVLANLELVGEDGEAEEDLHCWAKTKKLQRIQDTLYEHVLFADISAVAGVHEETKHSQDLTARHLLFVHLWC